VEGETQDSLALRMLVDQMTAHQQQVMLELQAMGAALQNQTAQVKSLQLEIAAVKHDAAEALAETRIKMQKLMEKTPTDPATQQKMVKEAQIRAKQEMMEAEARFKVALETMPRGDLTNDTGDVVRLIANGVSQVIVPGVNHNVPQAFIEHWEKRKDEKLWSDGLNNAFLARNKEGDFMGAEYYQDLLGQSALTMG
jgi:type I site-specific restriction endonuclease